MQMPELYLPLEELYNEGYECICGVDEAGRGPLAGPVFAAAVILPRGKVIPGLNDSKKLTDKKRRALFDVIKEESVSWCIASASHEEIDELNILKATFLAMNRAVAGLSMQPDIALVDGNRDPSLGINTRCIVKGDAVCASISAASVLAKVARDDWMMKMHEEYPMYAFDKHKGYPTKLHYSCIFEHGPSPIHRMSFLKNLEEHR